jgi:hypothetical protein
MGKENTVEDQDRKTPEEEVDVEGHAHRDVEEVAEVARQEDDVEAHSLRDVEEIQEIQRGDDREAQDIL